MATDRYFSLLIYTTRSSWASRKLGQRSATIGSCAAARANIDRKRSIKLFAFSKACLSLVVGLLPGHCAIGIHNVRWIYLMVSVHLKWSNGLHSYFYKYYLFVIIFTKAHSNHLILNIIISIFYRYNNP